MLFSIPQNGELTLRKFGDSNLLITERTIGMQLAAWWAARRAAHRAVLLLLEEESGKEDLSYCACGA